MFDFAVVIFGVRVFFFSPSTRFFRRRLPRGFRASAHVVNLLYHSARVLLSGDARWLRVIVTRTHARGNTTSLVTTAPFA